MKVYVNIEEGKILRQEDAEELIKERVQHSMELDDIFEDYLRDVKWYSLVEIWDMNEKTKNEILDDFKKHIESQEWEEFLCCEGWELADLFFEEEN